MFPCYLFCFFYTLRECQDLISPRTLACQVFQFSQVAPMLISLCIQHCRWHTQSCGLCERIVCRNTFFVVVLFGCCFFLTIFPFCVLQSRVPTNLQTTGAHHERPFSQPSERQHLAHVNWHFSCLPSQLILLRDFHLGAHKLTDSTPQCTWTELPHPDADEIQHSVRYCSDFCEGSSKIMSHDTSSFANMRPTSLLCKLWMFLHARVCLHMCMPRMCS